MKSAITFGPVPSRRLGRSLGINNIPPKHCSYGCRYCQVGPTHDKLIIPRPFYAPEEIAAAVRHHVLLASEQNEPIDYLTFVPDGEPSLDSRLADAIEQLRSLNIPIAVISNASLLWRDDVRQTLRGADWVSVKVDSVDESVWRAINRPHPKLSIVQVLDGIRRFADVFSGTLVSETMLVAGINDSKASIEHVAEFLQGLPLDRAYLAVPTRPTTDPAIQPPDEAVINRAYQQLADRLPRVETLIGYEGDAFASTGNVTEDILSISAVHPLRESALQELLRRNQSDWSQVQPLLDSGQLREVHYQGERFYTRRPLHPESGD